MAHNCPECDEICYCHGDIDDLVLNTDEAYCKCDHCPPGGTDFEEEEDEDA